MSPRDLPARREPKLPATVSLSGSGAPSNLRLFAAVTGRPGGFGSPEGAPIACRQPARLAALPRRRGSPATHPKVCRRGPDPASSLRRLPGPGGSASGLAAFVGSPESRVWPCGLRRFSRFRLRLSAAPEPRPVSSRRCFDCLERGELYGRDQAWSTRRFRRSDHECAGSGHRKKSDKSERTVTNATANDERAGQRWYASTSSYTDTI
jgi:hypothetical protein